MHGYARSCTVHSVLLQTSRLSSSPLAQSFRPLHTCSWGTHCAGTLMQSKCRFEQPRKTGGVGTNSAPLVSKNRRQSMAIAYAITAVAFGESIPGGCI